MIYYHHLWSLFDAGLYQCLDSLLWVFLGSLILGGMHHSKTQPHPETISVRLNEVNYFLIRKCMINDCNMSYWVKEFIPHKKTHTLGLVHSTCVPPNEKREMLGSRLTHSLQGGIKHSDYGVNHHKLQPQLSYMQKRVEVLVQHHGKPYIYNTLRVCHTTLSVFACSMLWYELWKLCKRDIHYGLVCHRKRDQNCIIQTPEKT